MDWENEESTAAEDQHKDVQRAGTLLQQPQAERIILPREISRETLEQPSSSWREPTGKLLKDFSQVHVAIEQGVL